MGTVTQYRREAPGILEISSFEQTVEARIEELEKIIKTRPGGGEDPAWYLWLLIDMGKKS